MTEEGQTAQATQVTLEVPAGWTEADVLKLLRKAALDEPAHEPHVPGEPDHHCWRKQPCLFWVSEGSKPWPGYCGLGSSTCLTRVFNHENPTRWLPRV